MSQVTIFLRDGHVFALTVDKPEKPSSKYFRSEEGLQDALDKRKAYESALASARESAVRVSNDIRADNIWVEIMEEGKLYTLGEEYKMRVESGCTPTKCPCSDAGLSEENGDEDCINLVATIYRDKQEETQYELWDQVFTEIEGNTGEERTTAELLMSKFTITRKKERE